MSQVVGRKGPERGPCLVCGAMFRSYALRKYCSLGCYLSSPQLQDRLRASNIKKTAEAAQRLGIDGQPLECECEHCRATFRVARLHRRRRFCTPQCRRKHYAERFDRWIANPSTLALPQNYDEFFSSEVLACPIEGCNWEGYDLGRHANFTHGVDAPKMRELLGCNRGTALCTPAISEARREVALAIGLPLMAVPFPKGISTPNTVPPSLEAKEHQKKASAELRHAFEPIERTCRVCGSGFLQTAPGLKKFCSIDCRSRQVSYGHPKVHECVCCVCGNSFLGTKAQSANSAKGRAMCSLVCRGRRLGGLRSKKAGVVDITASELPATAAQPAAPVPPAA